MKYRDEKRTILGFRVLEKIVQLHQVDRFEKHDRNMQMKMK
jgi:hypothetical protein